MLWSRCVSAQPTQRQSGNKHSQRLGPSASQSLHLTKRSSCATTASMKARSPRLARCGQFLTTIGIPRTDCRRFAVVSSITGRESTVPYSLFVPRIHTYTQFYLYSYKFSHVSRVIRRTYTRFMTTCRESPSSSSSSLLSLSLSS